MLMLSSHLIPGITAVTRHQETQRIQFQQIAKTYQEVHGHVLDEIYHLLQEHYYPRLTGKTVLDIGNGGQHPKKVLGRELSSRVKYFVGLDNSGEMLERAGEAYPKVVGDGLGLPFRSKSFDYVLANGLFHHLGFTRGGDNIGRVAALLTEAARVSREGIIMYEPFIPPFLESLERLAAAVLGYMPTFMWSAGSINEAIGRSGLEKDKTLMRRFSQLTGPWYWYIVIMDYPRFKLPVMLSPIRHMFFNIVLPNSGESHPREERAGGERLEEFLACPVCRGELTYGQDTIRCERCGGVFSYRNGIPVFTTP